MAEYFFSLPWQWIGLVLFGAGMLVCIVSYIRFENAHAEFREHWNKYRSEYYEFTGKTRDIDDPPKLVIIGGVPIYYPRTHTEYEYRSKSSGKTHWEDS